jgi:cap2 methyltransferase
VLSSEQRYATFIAEFLQIIYINQNTSTPIATIVLVVAKMQTGRLSIASNNAHCLQARNPRSDIPFERLLLPDAPMTPYRSRENERKTVVHWGQRKLLMSEIELLSMAHPPLEKRCVVIYAGAAPGTHVKTLSNMFPEHRFVLVDPAPFTVQVDGDRIITREAFFTDELAAELRAEYEGWHVLFVSDVRSTDPKLDGKVENERRIKIDMDAQAGWHRALRPFKSMLKFRPPYTPGTTRYLQGEIFLPVWGAISTTECRLVVDTDAEDTDYDNTEHEARMFHFNTVTRPALYPHGVRGCGIDHCYDCRAEVCILRKYLGGRASNNNNAIIAWHSQRISADISGYRTLAHPNPDPMERDRIIRQQQWIGGRPAYRN